jgi:hypothetical protein
MASNRLAEAFLEAWAVRRRVGGLDGFGMGGMICREMRQKLGLLAAGMIPPRQNFLPPTRFTTASVTVYATRLGLCAVA